MPHALLSSDSMFISDFKINPPFSSSDHVSLTSLLIINCGHSHAKTLAAEHCANEFYDFDNADYQAINGYLYTIDWLEEFASMLMLARCG